MRFAYYERLTAGQKAVYRKSDAIAAVPVPDAVALRPLAAALEAALATGKRPATARAATTLVVALCRQLGAPPVHVTVRLVRPALEGAELHGLYRFAAGEKPPTIDVWMKTAAHERVVRFRTFLRTLLHEVVHHLDVTLFALEDSYHTPGFFRRESSLVRQLLAPPQRKPPSRNRSEPTRRQLELFR